MQIDYILLYLLWHAPLIVTIYKTDKTKVTANVDVNQDTRQDGNLYIGINVYYNHLMIFPGDTAAPWSTSKGTLTTCSAVHVFGWLWKGHLPRLRLVGISDHCLKSCAEGCPLCFCV